MIYSYAQNFFQSVAEVLENNKMSTENNLVQDIVDSVHPVH